jgi:hypothetical protein
MTEVGGTQAKVFRLEGAQNQRHLAQVEQT